MEDSDFEEPTQSGHVELKKSFDLNAVLNGGDTFEINFDSVQADDNIDYSDTSDLTIQHDVDLAGACLGIDSDEDADDLNSTPFEKIAQKMTPVTEDGKIKKQIKRPGVGETPPCEAMVSVRYSSYLEYNDEPTDHAYIKKPYTFRLGHAVLFGLNLAVQSMKANEKSWFLFHPDYAFGAMGHPPRIPPNSTFLFQIELMRFVDSGPALQFGNLSLEDKRKFPVAYKTALGLIANAKEYFKTNIRLAIRDYNKAVSLLEGCTLSDMDEQEKHQKLLFRLYTNLAVCYTKDEKPRKACTMCNEIFKITRNTSIFVPAKVYFHNGRALFMLGDYHAAKQKLLKAQKLEPQNVDINNELLKVTNKMADERKKERTFAKAVFKDAVENNVNSTRTFQVEVRSLCDSLKNDDSDRTQFKLPDGLTQKEIETARVEAQNAGLKFIESDTQIFISKN